MEWMLSVSDHIVELVPSWQRYPDGTSMEVWDALGSDNFVLYSKIHVVSRKHLIPCYLCQSLLISFKAQCSSPSVALSNYLFKEVLKDAVFLICR